MSHGIEGFDHLVVAVQDLEAARDGWARLGFTSTPRGRHRNLATGNYCIMFPDDYVELIGIVDPSMPDRGLMSRMEEGGEGFDRLAFAVRDVDATSAALNDSGIGHRGPIDLHRPLELPEGEVEPRFRLVHFEDQETTPACMASSAIMRHRRSRVANRAGCVMPTGYCRSGRSPQSPKARNRWQTAGSGCWAPAAPFSPTTR